MTAPGLTLVLNGGWTAEAEVSRNSGRACLEAALAGGWQAEAIEVDRNLAATLLARKPARVFNALHGQMGEDGNIQGMLNLMEIPYTHSGLLASAIAMDKPSTKTLLAGHGIVFPEDIGFHVKGDAIILDDKTDDAIVIKPRNDGSSVGVVLARGETNTAIPPRSHWPRKTELMVERYIPGRDLFVGVLNGKSLTVTEVMYDNAFYDYEAKYADGGSRHQCPADIPQKVFDDCMDWAATAHRILACRGVSRADFRWDEKSDSLYMLEINTQPGMTATSLVPEQAGHCGIEMPDLITRLLETARCD